MLVVRHCARPRGERQRRGGAPPRAAVARARPRRGGGAARHVLETGLTAGRRRGAWPSTGPTSWRPPTQSPWRLLLDQFKNVLDRDPARRGGAVGRARARDRSRRHRVIVLFAVLLGFVQEYRAERAIEALREMAAPTATVVRDGERRRSPGARNRARATSCVLGRRQVPADGRLSEVVSLQVEEAALTGESLPVEKQTAPLADEELPRRRPHEHGLRRHERDLRPRARARGRHRDGDRVRRHRAAAADGRASQDAPSAEPGQGRADARRASRSSSCSSSSASACCAASRSCEMLLFGVGAGGRRRSRGAAGRDHDLAHARGAADGQAQRTRPSPARDRDARQRLRHRLATRPAR